MFPGHRGSIRLAFPRNGKSEYRQKEEEGFQEMDGKDFRASRRDASTANEGSDNRKVACMRPIGISSGSTSTKGT